MTLNATFNAPVTIHLVHKTHETRRLTVKYVNAKTGESMGSLAPDAVLDVYYKRTATKDPTTGQLTFGDWFWDTSEGDTATPGYHVVSGTWTTPASWANVAATVPTVSGYTSFTTGDWEKVGTNTSTVPANEFVFPTWNNDDNGTTDTSKGSLAYTSDANTYEATATHTVYFAPDETTAKTVTVNYKYCENGQVGGDVYSPAQLEIYYRAKATGYSTTGGITYGDYAFDTTGGDTSTPGFHVISVPDGASWDNLSTVTSANGNASIHAPVPKKEGYTALLYADATQANKNAEWIAAPITPGAFTGNTDSAWYNRLSRTIYYVPNSDIGKTIIRTVNITEPGQSTQSQTQTASLSRTAVINDTDTGVTYGDWNTGSWAAVTVPTVAGYTAVIKQTVDGTSSTVSSIPQVAVTSDSEDTTDDVTYVQNTANITISGTVPATTYNGQTLTVTDAMANAITNAVTAGDSHLTLPAGANNVKLDASDFSIADTTGNILTNPTDAGTYHIVLNANGLAKFKALDSNFTWNYDPQTSYVTYVVNKATPTVAFHAVGSKTYDGSAVLNNGGNLAFTTMPSVVITAPGTHNVSFQSGDFEFVNNTTGTVTTATMDTSGNISGPTDAGTYTIKLTAQGLQRIKDSDSNLDWSNVTVDSVGTGTFTINQATAAVTISGSNSKTYDGKTVSIDDLLSSGGTIKVTFTVPQNGKTTSIDYALTLGDSADYASDYSWNTTDNAAPKDAGTYTISLNKTAVLALINKELADSTSSVHYLDGNINVADTAVSGQATYTINKKKLTVALDGADSTTYTGNTIATPTSELIQHLTATGLVDGETLNTDTFDDADFLWYESDGTTILPGGNPTDVGTYYIGLRDDNQSGTYTLKRDNPNYDITYSGKFKYTVNKAAGKLTLSGSQTDTYSGAAHAMAGYTLTLQAPGIADGTQVTLKAGQLEFLEFSTDGGRTWSTNVPVNVGTYEVRLADSEKTALATEYPNIDWTKNAVENSANNYVINQNPVTISLTGNDSKTYDGKAADVDYNSVANTANITTTGLAAGQTLNIPTLTAADFDWYQGATKLTGAPTAAGTYTIKLNATGLKAISDANTNYKFTIGTNGHTYTINQATAAISFVDGAGQTAAWTGSATVLDPADFGLQISTNNGVTLTVPTGWTASDYQFYNAAGTAISTPTDIGSYKVGLSTAGLAKIETDTTNYKWTGTPQADYTIAKAVADVTLNGSAAVTYTGNRAVMPTNSDGSVKGITVTLSNGKSYTLKPQDLQFVTAETDDSGAVTGYQPLDTPTNAGTYLLRISSTGRTDIANAADGTHYQYRLVNTADFTINKADATITVAGSGSKTYDGSAADLSTGTYTIQLPGQSDATTVDSSDLVFVDSTGRTIAAPTAAGTYTVALSTAYQQQLKDQLGSNYNLTFASTGKFTINPEEVALILNGSASKTYDGQDAVITSSDMSGLTLSWGYNHSTTTAPGNVQFTLTPDDLEVVDDNGDPVSAANDTSGAKYWIKIKDSVLSQLNNGENSNYKFTIGDTYARYTIYARSTAMDLSGYQYVTYGDPEALSPAAFTLTFTDESNKSHTIALSAADIEFDLPTGTATDSNGLPVNSGQYKVKLTDAFIKQLNSEYPNYEISEEGVNSNARYVVRHRALAFTLSGKQKVTYNGSTPTIDVSQYTLAFGQVGSASNSGVASRDAAAFNSFKLQAGDLAFVQTDPVNAGTYQVHLSAAGLARLQALDPNGNYDWSSVITSGSDGKFAASSVTADFKIKKEALYVGLADKDSTKVPSSKFGDFTIPASDYTLTITDADGNSVKDASGATMSYALTDGSVIFKDGIPSKVGTYDVVLRNAALEALGNTYGTTNYKYSSSSTAKREITKGDGTINVRGSQETVYTGSAATIDPTQYTLVVHTAMGDVTEPLTAAYASILGFYNPTTDASGKTTWTSTAAPTNVGDYHVGITADLIGELEALDGNNGDNYNWNINFGSYKITPATGSAKFEGSVSKDYDGTPISDLSNLTVTVSYPGQTSTTYQLQAGDYDFVKDGVTYTAAPSDAGTYTIELTAQGKRNIAKLGNVADSTGKVTTTNVEWPASAITGTGTYTINPIRMFVTEAGTQTETYDGTAKTLTVANFIPTISAGSVKVPTIPTTGANALTASDFTIEDADGNTVTSPTDAGTYKVYLNSNGFAKLQALSSNFTYPASITSYGTLVIKRKDVTVTEGSDGTTFKGRFLTHSDMDVNKILKPIKDAGYNTTGLTIDYFDWWLDDTMDYGANGPKDAGDYNIRLNADGRTKLDKDNPNYNISLTDFHYTIYKANAIVSIDTSDPQNEDWNNEPITLDVSHFKPSIKVTDHDGNTISNPITDAGGALTIPAGVNFTAADYEFVDDQGHVITSFTHNDGTTSAMPLKVGTYHVRLTASGWQKLEQSTDNYAWSYDGSEGTVKINTITPTIQLTGTAYKIYDGQPVSYAEVSAKDADGNPGIYVYFSSKGTTIKIPLYQGAYDWSVNGQKLPGAPSNVGIYNIGLDNDQVVKIVQQMMKDNSDYTDSMNILAKNISGSALFDILPASITQITQAHSGSQYYDGQPATAALSDIVSGLNADGLVGNDKLNTANLTTDDFDWYQGSTKLTAVPANVGKYTVKINSAGINALQQNNPNYTINAETPIASYSYEIKPATATATLNGSGQKTYDRQAVSLDDLKNNGINVAITIPQGSNSTVPTLTYTLQAGDYTWNTKDGKAPTAAGTYTLSLNKANIIKHLQAQIKSDQNWNGNVTIDEDNIAAGTASFTINKRDAIVNFAGRDSTTYTGDPINMPLAEFKRALTANLVQGDTLNTDSLTFESFRGFIGADESDYIRYDPVKSGTYSFILKYFKEYGKEQGLGQLAADNPNYSFSIGNNGFIYTVDPAVVDVTIGKSKTVVYTGRAASDNAFTVAFTLPNSKNRFTYTLQNGDFTWRNGSSESAAAPVNVGTYTLELTAQGKANLQRAIDAQFGDGLDNKTSNVSLGKVTTSTITITPAKGTATLSGKVAKIYDGSAIDLDTGATPIKVTVAYPGATSTTYALQAGDYEFVGQDGTVYDSAHAPVNAGDYTIRLTKQGQTNIAKLNAANVDWSGASAISGTGGYQISPRPLTVTIPASEQDETYDGAGKGIDLTKLVPTLAAGDVTVPTIPTTGKGALTAADYTITDQDGHKVAAPTNAGTYNISLNSTGLAKLAKLSANFTWPATAKGHGTLVIKAATANASLAGAGQKVYDGTAVTTTQVNADGEITVKAAYDKTPATSFPFVALAYTDGDSLLTYTLQDGDYTWNTTSGSAPVSVGHYTISLTKQGMRHLQAALDRQVGKGNIALTARSAGTAEFDITPFKLNISLSGSAAVPAGTTQIPSDTYALDYQSGEKGAKLPTGLVEPSGKLAASQLEFVGAVPTKDSAGQSYTVGYKGGQTALQTLLGKNYQVSYQPSTSNYVVTKASSQTVEYVDGAGHVIKTLSPLKGDKGSTVAFDNAANMPAGWVIADGETAPTTIKIAGGTTQIKIKHGTKEISIKDPADWPAHYTAGDFQRAVTRTINVTAPNGHVTTVKQVATLNRTAVKDLVTNQVLSWNDWSAGSWAEYDVPEVAGYAPSQDKVAQETVTNATSDSTVNISYVKQPTEPTEPTVPSVPSQPTGESQPTSVTTPGQPSGSTQPTSVTTPGQPSGSTQPTSVTTPGQPSGNTQPTSVTTPNQPSGSTQPTSVTTPGQPSGNTQPTSVTTPNQPSGNTQPTSVTTPGQPSGNTQPTSITTPGQPSGSTQPTSVTTPGQPSGNTQPTNVTTPNQPSGSTQPTSVTTPGQPSGSTQPTSVTTPVQPSGNTQPTSVTTPGQPSGSTQPTSVTTPNQPSGNTQPTSVTTPVQPSGNTQPTSVATPVQPSGSTQPTSVATPTPGQSATAGQANSARPSGSTQLPLTGTAGHAGKVNAAGKQTAGQQKAADSSTADKLPQTGNSGSKATTTIGSLLLSLLGLFGFAARKKKKQE